MKAAFDALPLYIMERLNDLIEEIEGEDFFSTLLGAPSGIREGHTLADLLQDVKSGALAEYLVIQDRTLTGIIEQLALRIGTLEGMPHYSAEDFHLDGGTPALRLKEVSA